MATVEEKVGKRKQKARGPLTSFAVTAVEWKPRGVASSRSKARGGANPTTFSEQH